MHCRPLKSSEVTHHVPVSKFDVMSTLIHISIYVKHGGNGNIERGDWKAARTVETAGLEQFEAMEAVQLHSSRCGNVT